MSNDTRRLLAAVSLLLGAALLIVPWFGPPNQMRESVLRTTLAAVAVWFGARSMWKSTDPSRYVALAGFAIGVFGLIGLSLHLPRGHHRLQHARRPDLVASPRRHVTPTAVETLTHQPSR
ncbi:MAG: hypothetical protein H6833_11470 [Planctomycetes bacterium]|nr:hypothetical protein [Planctomycetota bacterium]